MIEFQLLITIICSVIFAIGTVCFFALFLKEQKAENKRRAERHKQLIDEANQRQEETIKWCKKMTEKINTQ